MSLSPNQHSRSHNKETEAKPSGKTSSTLVTVLISVISTLLVMGLLYGVYSMGQKRGEKETARLHNRDSPITEGIVSSDDDDSNIEIPISDRDADGIPDENDKCPNTPEGTKVNSNGCPDSDGDGVYDNNDHCPREGVKGKVDEKGCPSRPKDSVSETCRYTKRNLAKQTEGTDFDDYRKMKARLEYLRKECGFNYDSVISKDKIGVFQKVARNLRDCQGGNSKACDSCLELVSNPLLNQVQKQYLAKNCSEY